MNDKKKQLSKFRLLFKNGSISEIAKVIDEGSLDNLDLDSLDAVYQVFIERHSEIVNEDSGFSAFFPDRDITDSNNDPLLVVKFFCDKGMSSAAKDLKEHLIRVFMTGSIEEFIYIWEMGYFTYLEEFEIKMWGSTNDSTLNKILKTSSIDESIVISICKDFNILNWNHPNIINFKTNRLTQKIRNEPIDSLMDSFDNYDLLSMPKADIESIFMEFHAKFQKTPVKTQQGIEAITILKLFSDLGIQTAISLLSQIIPEIQIYDKFNDIEFLFDTKNEFVNFLKNKLHEGPESFRIGAFPLIRSVKDRPEFVAIIKEEILKEEIEKINNFEKLGDLPGSVGYYFHSKETEALYNNDPEIFFYHTIMESDIFKLYYFDINEGIYVAGVESPEKAVDLVIHSYITYWDRLPGIMKKEDIQDLLDLDILDPYANLSYVGLDNEIAKALIYLELKMEFTLHMDVTEINEEDMKPANLYKNFSGASDLYLEIEELKDKMSMEDVDNFMEDPDFEKIKEYENDLLVDLHYTNKEHIYQDLIEQQAKEEEYYREIYKEISLYGNNILEEEIYEFTNSILHRSRIVKIQNIFRRESKFDVFFIPNKIPHREKELSLLSQLFLSLITDPNPSSRKILVTGKPHTGKTTTILFLAKTLVKAANKRNVAIKYIYVDCKEFNTRDKVVNKIADELNQKHKFLESITEKLHRSSSIKKIPHILLILDDLDYSNDEPEEIINLQEHIKETAGISEKNISIISIVSSLKFLETYIGENIGNLRRNIIEFKPFSREQLFDILNYRTSLGMYPDAYSAEIIEMITDLILPTGDVRYGMEVLWEAGKVAEARNLRQITPECIHIGQEKLSGK